MKDLRKLQTDTEFQDKLKEFSKKYFRKKTKKILKLIQNGQIPKSDDYENVWTELIPLFSEKQDKRCAICQQEMFTARMKSIEHYRPKNHYWWLAYNPQNYYLVCTDCNGYKSTNFPLHDIQIDYISRENINNEKPLLLNPLKDNPNDYFQLFFVKHPLTKKGIVILQSKKGLNLLMKAKADKTIEIYNLDLHSEKNRSDESRFDLLNKYYNDLFEIAKARKSGSKAEFIYIVKQKLKERPELKTLDLLELIKNNPPTIDELTD